MKRSEEAARIAGDLLGRRPACIACERFLEWAASIPPKESGELAVLLSSEKAARRLEVPQFRMKCPDCEAFLPTPASVKGRKRLKAGRRSRRP